MDILKNLNKELYSKRMSFLKELKLFSARVNWLLKTPVDWPAWYKIKQELKTPKEVRDYMQDNFVYESEEVDNIQPAPVMFQNKAGDCDDYSQFAYEILKANGYNVFLLAVFTKEVGHAVCVIREGDTYSHLSNWGYYNRGYKTLEDVYKGVYKDYVKVRHYDSYLEEPLYKLIQKIRRP